MKLRVNQLLLILVVLIITPGFVVATEMVGNKKEVKAKINWNPVMDAIIEVESGGNKNAVCGNSVGAMQITPVLVNDCNRILKERKSSRRFKLSDRYNVKKSKEMFLIVQSFYNPSDNIEKAIRTWNGGLHYKKLSTNSYYRKVMKAMKE